ncbi:unnamed protein product [Amaranthus hypochondriacus]
MDNHKKAILVEKLKEGLEAATQLRSLIPSINETLSDHDERNDEIKMGVINQASTVLDSLENSISIVKNMAQSLNRHGSPLNNHRQHIVEASDVRRPDGYTWRKYGQKLIRNTPYPREYFRCIYRENQNCRATKKVEKIPNSPTKYRITYCGDHTCQRDLINNTNNLNVLDPIPEDDETNNYINFESENPITIPEEALNNPSVSLDHMVTTTTTTTRTTTTTMTTITTTTTTMEPSFDIATYFNQEPDKVFSPEIFINLNYMGSSNIESTIDYSLLTSEHFDINSDLEDFPIWD